MPKYTVQSPSGKKVTFQWDAPEPPTDADMDEIFGEVDTPDFSDVQGGGFGAFQPPPTATSSFSAPRLPRRFIGDEPDWAKAGEEFIKGGAENLGDRAVGQLKGAAQGASNLAKVVGLDLGSPTFNEDRPEELAGAGEARAMLPAMAGGGLGVVGAGALGGAAETGTVEGTAVGAALGGLTAGAGVLGSKALGLADQAFPHVKPFLKGAVLNSPLLGPMLKGGINAAQKASQPIAKPLAQVREEAAAALEAERLAKAAKAHGVNSGTAPGPAFPAPPGMGASGPPPVPKVAPAAPVSGSGVPAPEPMSPPPGFKPSPASGSTGTTVVPKPKAAPAAPPKPKHTVDEAVNRIKAAKTPQERGAIIKELAAGGSDKASRGAALSNATNKPLDIDDLSEAKDFLKQAGSLDKALEIIRNHPENSVQDVIRLTRAVREASRAK